MLYHQPGSAFKSSQNNFSCDNLIKALTLSSSGSSARGFGTISAQHEPTDDVGILQNSNSDKNNAGHISGALCTTPVA